MISTKAYSELLRTLYEAPFDETQWQLFLTQLCEFTHSRVAMFVRNDGANGNRLLASGGSPAIEADRHQAVHRFSDPFREAFLRNPRVGVIEGDDLVPHAEWIKSEVYRAVAAPFGVEHMTCMALSDSSRAHDLINLWRGPDRPQLEQEYRELLTMLIPHLQNVLKLRKIFAAAEDRARNAEAMLNSSSTAYVLLNRSGEILHMNEAAHAIAGRSDGLFIHADRISPTDRSMRAAFGALVRACGTPKLNHPGGAVALGRSSCLRPLQVLIAPVRAADTDPAEIRVLLTITDPDKATEFSDATLRQIYGFTPAETGIANALLAGSSLDEIARLRTVSVATIRSQMKNLLGKTDTQRQGDLIRILSTLPHTGLGRTPIRV